jgi:hypothetical protein
MAKKYQVRVTNGLRAITSANRSVAGLSIAQDGTGYVGELSDEQLDELKNDRYVTVTNEDGSPLDGVDYSKPANPTSTEYEDAQAAERQAFQEEAEKNKEAESTQSESQTEAAPPTEPTDLGSMSRADLNAHAASVGVEKPETLPNRPAVIEAIQATSKES